MCGTGTLRELASFLDIPRASFEQFEASYSPPGEKRHGEDLRDHLRPADFREVEAALKNSSGPQGHTWCTPTPCTFH